MKSSKTLEKVRRVYDYAETTLWAALLAFVIHFVVFVIAKMREIRAQNETAQVQEIAAENVTFCEKFGMKVGTNKYSQCLFDLQEFRTKVEKRIRDENGYW